jgi:hypothetical protein
MSILVYTLLHVLAKIQFRAIILRFSASALVLERLARSRYDASLISNSTITKAFTTAIKAERCAMKRATLNLYHHITVSKRSTKLRCASCPTEIVLNMLSTESLLLRIVVDK